MARTNRRRNNRLSRRRSNKHRGFLGGGALAENSATTEVKTNNITMSLILVPKL